MMSDFWQVFALKYAERNARTRGDSFIFDDNHDAPHAMDYFIWVLRRGTETIIVDTGYDGQEAGRRDRAILREPFEALAVLGIDAQAVDTVILTHLHYDHAGGLDQFSNATIHMQAAEMAYATGPCMCHDVLQMPFTVDHVCEVLRRVYSGRVVFHTGDGQIADGVTVHCIGGHSRGLQAVRVKTESGWMCLASDAAHFYENVYLRKPFPIVVDLQDMLDGFGKIERLASSPALIIPGHDPLVRQHFPVLDQKDFVYRLDRGPERPITLK